MVWVCFLFGDDNAPKHLRKMIYQAVKSYYSLGYRVFIVGNTGNFDRMAAAALRRLRFWHRKASVYLMTPFSPSERDIPLPRGFDFPFQAGEKEDAPDDVRIRHAKEYMLTHCDGVICYARYPGEATDLYNLVSEEPFTRNIAWEEERKEGIYDHQISLEETMERLRKAAGVEE